MKDSRNYLISNKKSRLEKVRRKLGIMGLGTYDPLGREGGGLNALIVVPCKYAIKTFLFKQDQTSFSIEPQLKRNFKEVLLLET